jgi:anti-sigma factor RsiW
MYVDGELDTARAAELQRHLETCEDCFRARQRLLAVRQALRAEVPRYSAPASLASRVSAALRRAARSTPASMPRMWEWVPLAISAAAVLFVFFYNVRPASSFDETQEIVASHTRSLLLPEHLMDVVSTDRHTVKPWFAGKIEYAPPVRSLDDKGFKLVGGRLDFVNRHKVAVLVYERRKHTINFFVWPDDEGPVVAKESRTQHGFNLVPYHHSGMTGWAISDLEQSELEDFVRLFES